MSVLTTVAGLIVLAAEDAEFDPNSVTPGVVGFVATALLGLAVIFLGFDLVRRLRRSKYRHEIRESLAAEIAERDAAAGAAAPGSTPENDGAPAAPRE